ncbi:MAG: polysaccharide pyruvyl transferase CsaB [Negativicutes bacterium]|nr:polysaccharide pyruvyl transferase CsaB [Negativicutes bacterium]
MSDIVISGYYGFANAGDEAMLTAMIEVLTDLDPNMKITVISGNPADTSARHGVKSVYRLNYPEIVRALAKTDLLISGGGSLLQDVTSDRSLYYYLSIMMIAKKLGKPVMLYAQGIGPVRGSMARGAMRYIGNMVDLITVRDEGSRDELKRLAVTKPPVHVTADPVVAMHPVDKQIGRSILRKHDVGGGAPLVGISVREWKDWSHYKQVLGQVADQIITEYGARIVYLPMQWPEDLTAATKIASRSKLPATVLTSKYTTSELLSLIGNFDMLISVRLHALIFASVMHVPMIGLSYDPKIDRFLETIGERHAGTLKSIQTEPLMNKVKAMWPEINRPNLAREEKINSLRQKACFNAELALELINKTRR